MTGRERERDRPAVTPPRDRAERPTVVTVAVVLWIVLGVVLLGLGVLYLITLVAGGAAGGSSVAALVAAAVVLIAGGVGVVLGARHAGRGRAGRAAR